MTVESAIGTATIMHQLALGVVCLDSVSGAPVRTPVRVGRQVAARILRDRSTKLDPSWPCADLEASGRGRFKLRYGPSVARVLVVRVDDPARRYVPRRFSVHLWPTEAATAAAQGPYIPVASRLLRLWLSPGSAYLFPRGTTLIRGRVATRGVPVRWARVTATGPNDRVAGRAHADDRGEFLLVVTDPDQNPLQDTVDLDLVAFAPKAPGPVDSRDRCADVAVETVSRSSAPPFPQDLDNALLRGIRPPPGYVPSVQPQPVKDVRIGAELTLRNDVPFKPQA
jgi:hypothetical protein